MRRDLHWRPVLRGVLVYIASSLAIAAVLLPLTAQQAVERVALDERLGTLPVVVSLTHNDRSTLATGVLGDVNYKATGPFGFGIRARVTGPPEAGGTLASYADPEFIRNNLYYVNNPQAVVQVYGREFRAQILRDALLWAGVGGLAGGAVVLLLWTQRAPPRRSRARRAVLIAALLAGSMGLSAAGAAYLLHQWSTETAVAVEYPLPGFPVISFSSPQTRELARQIKPFIEKNARRTEVESQRYQATAEASFGAALTDRLGEVTPRDGEVLVVAEADPQGGYVGMHTRTALMAALVDRLGEDAAALRTISGDITSNGTVAEGNFVRGEAAVGDGVPTAAVAGDHDSDRTVAQMKDAGMVVPDLEQADVGGLRVWGANDVEEKALFGQLVKNRSGLTEQELGAELRDRVPSDHAVIVLLHQPAAAEGYLGVSLDSIASSDGGSPTTPHDDEVADLPAGTVSIGHKHDLDGPWVVWNTDGDRVTWTVVDQLGTSGGMEEAPTFNRFSTPISPPLKTLSFRFQFIDTATGLQTGYATVTCDIDVQCAISPRTDVGLPVSDPRVGGSG